MMNAIRWIKQFAGKKSQQSLSRLFERDVNALEGLPLHTVLHVTDSYENTY